jgi:AraC-like DNA-binding protein
MVAGQLSSPGANPFADAQAQLRRESRINEYIQTLKERRRSEGADPELPSYPIEKESELLRSIRERNTERAQAVLNQLLGHVFFAYGGDVEALRHRSRELIVLLSRITISNGAEPERVFGLNYQFLDGLESRNDVNEIAHWMSRIVRRFAEFVFTVPPGTAHFGPLRRVVSYVHAHYRRRLTLRELAQVAGLSGSYLSRLFHDEMGEPLSHFIRRVRVDKAQELLLGTNMALADIAAHVGFANQSHLSSVFKEHTGRTPGAYRSHAHESLV